MLWDVVNTYLDENDAFDLTNERHFADLFQHVADGGTEGLVLTAVRVALACVCRGLKKGDWDEALNARFDEEVARLARERLVGKADGATAKRTPEFVLARLMNWPAGCPLKDAFPTLESLADHVRRTVFFDVVDSHVQDVAWALGVYVRGYERAVNMHQSSNPPWSPEVLASTVTHRLTSGKHTCTCWQQVAPPGVTDPEDEDLVGNALRAATACVQHHHIGQWDPENEKLWAFVKVAVRGTNRGKSYTKEQRGKAMTDRRERWEMAMCVLTQEPKRVAGGMAVKLSPSDVRPKPLKIAAWWHPETETVTARGVEKQAERWNKEFQPPDPLCPVGVDGKRVRIATFLPDELALVEDGECRDKTEDSKRRVQSLAWVCTSMECYQRILQAIPEDQRGLFTRFVIGPRPGQRSPKKAEGALYLVREPEQAEAATCPHCGARERRQNPHTVYCYVPGSEVKECDRAFDDAGEIVAPTVTDLETLADINALRQLAGTVQAPPDGTLMTIVGTLEQGQCLWLLDGEQVPDVEWQNLYDALEECPDRPDGLAPLKSWWNNEILPRMNPKAG